MVRAPPSRPTTALERGGAAPCEKTADPSRALSTKALGSLFDLLGDVVSVRFSVLQNGENQELHTPFCEGWIDQHGDLNSTV